MPDQALACLFWGDWYVQDHRGVSGVGRPHYGDVQGDVYIQAYAVRAMPGNYSQRVVVAWRSAHQYC